MSEEERKQKARENARRYYRNNKEKVLAKQKIYVKKKYATDEEYRKKCYERSRKYIKNNMEKVREAKRRWANKHYQELIEKGLKPKSKAMKLRERIDMAIKYIDDKGRLKYKPSELKKILKGEMTYK